MKNTKKAFTLVELIVVITILAILGTIAFISLQGYSQEAKNSKVTSDLRNITSAIETDSTRNGTTLSDIISNAQATGTNDVSWTFGSGANDGTGVVIDIATNYGVGNVNFAKIGQNGEDFKDPNAADDTDYLYAYVTDAQYKGYQVAGQVVVNDVVLAAVSGTYYQVDATSDVVGLISSTTTTAPIITEQPIAGFIYP